jgi:squalene-associated FAD-dependent desaturase
MALMPRMVHVIGAGLAGLSAAVRLVQAGHNVTVHEAAPQAGGRCRSYFDQTLGMVIDNGNHLVLSGNHATLDFLRAIGASDRLVGPPEAAVDFIDLATCERWTLRPNAGRIPWWIFVPGRRVPGTSSSAYVAVAARLALASPSQRIGDVLSCHGPLYDRLLHPFLLAALNTDPPAGSAALARALIAETFVKGGAACRPLVAREGLGAAFVDPALHFLEQHGATVRFGSRLRGLRAEGDRIESLDFGEDAFEVDAQDAVVLAVPPPVASALIPDLPVPVEFRAIVNAHFRIAPAAGLPPLIGVINGAVEWIFAFPDRLSVTISSADRLLDAPREKLAAAIWQDIARVTGIEGPMPPWQIVRERRATFAATPDQNTKRPGPQTRWTNLALAGDWTATGLPATIESAIRSGLRAAEIVTSRANSMGLSGSP